MWYPDVSLNALHVAFFVSLIAANISVALSGVRSGWNGGTVAWYVMMSAFIRGALVLYGLFVAVAWHTALLLVLYTLVVGGGIELVGLRYGVPFGRYRYTTLLRPRIAGLPLQIALEWVLVAVPTWGLLSVLNLSPVLFVGASALIITGWDLFYDHFFVAIGLWRWERRSAASKVSLYGIPWTNYAGWFLTGVLLSSGALYLFPIGTLSAPDFLSAYYLLMFIMQVGLQFFIVGVRPYVVFSVALWAVGWPLCALATAGHALVPLAILVGVQLAVGLFTLWITLRRGRGARTPQ